MRKVNFWFPLTVTVFLVGIGDGQPRKSVPTVQHVCRNVTDVENLDYNKMQGTWFKMFGRGDQLSESCGTITYTQHNAGAGFKIVRDSNSTTETFMANILPTSGKVLVNINGILFNHFVVSTDYDNFCVVYFCPANGDNYPDLFWVLSRSETMKYPMSPELQQFVWLLKINHHMPVTCEYDTSTDYTTTTTVTPPTSTTEIPESPPTESASTTAKPESPSTDSTSPTVISSTSTTTDSTSTTGIQSTTTTDSTSTTGIQSTTTTDPTSTTVIPSTTTTDSTSTTWLPSTTTDSTSPSESLSSTTDETSTSETPSTTTDEATSSEKVSTETKPPAVPSERSNNLQGFQIPNSDKTFYFQSQIRSLYQ